MTTYLDRHDNGLFHKFETKTTKNPSITAIKPQFSREPKAVEPFYTKGVSPYLSKLNDDVFVLGGVDLFITSSKTELKAAIKQELADKVLNVAEEAIGN